MVVEDDGFDVAAATHIGRSRKENQDHYIRADEWLGQERRDLCDRYGRLYIVADGVGGRAGGAEASKMVVERVMRHFYADDLAPTAPPQRLRAAIDRANAEIHAQASSRQNKMASTLVAALIHRSWLTIANIGDSPAFLLRRAERPKLLTVEHSITDPSGATCLTQAMGDANVQSAISSIAFAPDDIVVLCSDGLSSLVEPDEIQRIVSRQRAAQATQSLIRLANQRGGYDNITVLVVRNGVSQARAPRSWRTIMAVAAALFSVAAIAALLILAPGWLNDSPLSARTTMPTLRPGPASPLFQSTGTMTAVGTAIVVAMATDAMTPALTQSPTGTPPIASVRATSTLAPTVTPTRTPRPTRTPTPTLATTDTPGSPTALSATPPEPTAASTQSPSMPNDLVGMREEAAINRLLRLGVPRANILVNRQCRDDISVEDQPKFDQAAEGTVLSMEPRGNESINPATVTVHLAVRASDTQCVTPTAPASTAPVP
ncbi:MAG: protein phosphatase 2C domain-containing protein [Roseiflexaceae bacterium]